MSLKFAAGTCFYTHRRHRSKNFPLFSVIAWRFSSAPNRRKLSVLFRPPVDVILITQWPQRRANLFGVGVNGLRDTVCPPAHVWLVCGYVSRSRRPILDRSQAVAVMDDCWQRRLVSNLLSILRNCLTLQPCPINPISYLRSIMRSQTIADSVTKLLEKVRGRSSVHMIILSISFNFSVI